LPWVENGTIILIGATTENPFFEVNKALVSRSRIFQLQQLTDKDLYKIVEQTLADSERGYGKLTVQMEVNVSAKTRDITKLTKQR
jgi:putative ATPase